MATTKVINDLIDLNQTGNTQALKGCVGTTAQQPTGVEGALRTNTDLSSASSTSAMQFYKSTAMQYAVLCLKATCTQPIFFRVFVP